MSTTTQRLLATLSRGDTLAIRPDVGMPYRCDVLEVDADEQTVKIRFSTPRGSKTRTHDAVEMAGWQVRGDLIINPPNRPHVGTRRRTVR